MTFKYWFKILLGMVVIFVIGSVVAKQINRVKATINSDDPLTVPLFGAPFQLAGNRLGKIDRLRIERSAPRSASGIALTVNLDDGVLMSRFDDCALAFTDATKIDKNTTFVCATAADSSRLQLVPFGTVTFRPGDHQVTLLVPQSVASGMQHNFVSGANNDEDGNVDVGTDSGSVHVRINGKDLVSIIGDSSGGSIKVYDKSGRAIVDIAGDSSGRGHVIVKDSTGATKVDVKANTPPRKSGGS